MLFFKKPLGDAKLLATLDVFWHLVFVFLLQHSNPQRPKPIWRNVPTHKIIAIRWFTDRKISITCQDSMDVIKNLKKKINLSISNFVHKNVEKWKTVNFFL